jgi:dTDP-4-amino-4,6-dideoxygalactose transaminase
MKVHFLDLKKQYLGVKEEIDGAIRGIVENETFIMGKPVLDFENSISAYLGQKSLGCASGSDALLLALMACGIKSGDEVITTPFTFFATAGAIARLGAKPVFVDIDERTFNIDVDKIEKAITKKTRAVIPVHLFGQPARMDNILQLAHKHGLKVIEDAAQAIGAEYGGRKVGTIGDFGCFSFFPTKNLGAYGDGGLITCKDEANHLLVKKLRVHGAEVKYYHDFVGINSRLDALQAAVLSVKLKRIDEWNKARFRIAERYTAALKGLVITPHIEQGVRHVFHQYAILVEDSKRDALLNFLKEKGIDAGVYYPLPLHLQRCFSNLGYSAGSMPVAEKTCKRILSLPIFPELSDAQIEYVIKSVHDFFDQKTR